MSTAGNPQGLFGLWVVLGKVFSEFCQSESWAVLLAQSDLWESVFVLVNIVIALLLVIAYLFFTIRTVQKKHSPRYQPRAYISPLNIAKEFRERWRTRWKHQAYHEVIQSLSGEQCEIRNYRPVKNTFSEHKKTEHEVSVTEYKKRLQLAKKVIGYDAAPDSRNKKSSVVFKSYFRKKKSVEYEEPQTGKHNKKRMNGETEKDQTSSNATPHPPLSHQLSCNFCTQNFEYYSEQLPLIT